MSIQVQQMVRVEILSLQAFKFSCASCKTYILVEVMSPQRDQLSVLRCPICTEPMQLSPNAVTQYNPYHLLHIIDEQP